VPVAHDMKSDILALVMANMNSESAKELTVKLANKLALPPTADALMPPAPVAPVAAAAPAAAPVTAAAAAPAAKTPMASPEKQAAPKG